MNEISVFSADGDLKRWLDMANAKHKASLRYIAAPLTAQTASLAGGSRAVICETGLDETTASELGSLGVSAACVIGRGAGERLCGVERVASAEPSPADISEYLLALMMTLMKKTHRAYNRAREGSRAKDGLAGASLFGKTVGIIGVGKVGARFGAVCAALGMKCIAFDPEPKWGMGMEFTSLNEVMRVSDVICLACPDTSETYRLIDRHNLRLMKRGVNIVGSCAPSIIEPNALAEALRSGAVSGAGIDLYGGESEVRAFLSGALAAEQNAIITIGLGGYSEDTRKKVAEDTLDNLSRYFCSTDCADAVKASKE